MAAPRPKYEWRTQVDGDLDDLRKIKRLLNRALKTLKTMEKYRLKIREQEREWAKKREVIE